MNEARFSITTKFDIGGFDSLLTIRDDDSLIALLKLNEEAIKGLQGQGAIPGRRWENNKASGTKNASRSDNHGAPECPVHHLSRLGKRGYFCPAREENGEYCTWEAPAPKGAA